MHPQAYHCVCSPAPQPFTQPPPPPPLLCPQPYFVGNAPAGHVQLGDGTTFLHRCQLIQGVPALKGGSGYSEYVWAAKVRSRGAEGQ